MGRVLKNATTNNDAYVVAPPALISPRSLNGNGKHDGDESYVEPVLDLFEDDGLPSTPPAPERDPIDWEALHREAAALIDAASSDAEAILEDVRGRARAILDAATSASGGISEAAHAEGHTTGRAEGVEAADREMEEMLLSMRGLVEMARVERHKIVENAEPEIVRLAMGIAERILHKQIELDPKVVIEMTKAAVARLVDRESVTVRVNPADLESMRVHRDDMLALGETKHMRIIEDQRVDRGGVIVETESGSLDAKISTQLREAKRVLHIEDEVVVSPAPDSPLAAVPEPIPLRVAAS